MKSSDMHKEDCKVQAWLGQGSILDKINNIVSMSFIRIPKYNGKEHFSVLTIGECEAADDNKESRHTDSPLPQVVF